MPSYYQVINGVRYDRELLESSDRLTTGAGDGRISVDDGALCPPPLELYLTANCDSTPTVG